MRTPDKISAEINTYYSRVKEIDGYIQQANADMQKTMSIRDDTFERARKRRDSLESTREKVSEHIGRLNEELAGALNLDALKQELALIEGK